VREPSEIALSAVKVVGIMHPVRWNERERRKIAKGCFLSCDAIFRPIKIIALLDAPA